MTTDNRVEEIKQPEQFKQFIVQKAFGNWASENKTFINDLQNLIQKMIMFEVKYGKKILYEFDKTPSKQGRGLVEGIDKIQ